MAADFSDYQATNKVEDYVADKGQTHVVSNSNGLGDLVVRIIQSQFPDFTSKINTRVTSKPAEQGYAEYGGLAGDEIKLGNIKAPISHSEIIKGKDKGLSWNANNVSTDSVIEAVTDTLHELYHARSATANQSYKAGLPAGADWQGVIKDAQAAGFPSVGKHVFGGDNIEEFMATAEAVNAMKKIGTPTGRYANVPETLQRMGQKYPWLPGYIQKYAEPTTAPKDPPRKSILDIFK